MKPRTPTAFTLIPAVNDDGKPVVVIDFGRFGRITLDGDDIERFVALLEAKLREALELGST